MNRLIIWIVALYIVAACSTQKKLVEENKDIEKAVEDSLEYGMRTFDSKYESWYLLHNNPAEYKSKQYYESWNQQYVSAWNNKAKRRERSSFFQRIEGYKPGVDYGFELNHKLFYYFQYVENILKIPIINGGPKVVEL